MLNVSITTPPTNNIFRGCKLTFWQSNENFVHPDAEWQPFKNGYLTIHLHSDGSLVKATDSIIAVIVWQDRDRVGKFETAGLRLFTLYPNDTIASVNIEFGVKNGKTGTWLVVRFTDEYGTELMETEYLE